MDVWVLPYYQDPRYSVPEYSPMDHSRSIEVKALGRLGKEDPLVMDLVVLLCYQDPCFGQIGDALHWEGASCLFDVGDGEALLDAPVTAAKECSGVDAGATLRGGSKFFEGPSANKALVGTRTRGGSWILPSNKCCMAESSQFDQAGFKACT